jgi:hypothetical protein
MSNQALASGCGRHGRRKPLILQQNTKSMDLSITFGELEVQEEHQALNPIKGVV